MATRQLAPVDCFRLRATVLFIVRALLALLIARRHTFWMQYTYFALSPSDFEALSADLIGRDLGIRFELFAEGPDGGMDGRHATGTGDVILQAKHYDKSGYSALKSKMKAERASIDRLDSKRYVLVTSVSLTPGNKSELAELIGPSLQGSADIYGKEDLDGLLRKYQDVLIAHPNLWQSSGEVLKAIVTEAMDERERLSILPSALAALLREPKAEHESDTLPRDVIFIIKATPTDDEFTQWLGPKLEARGYRVFADILTLEPGDRWRRVISRILEHRAAKVLVLCSSKTLGDDAVQDGIEHAREISHALNDPRFIIPLRLEDGSKISDLRDAVPVDFVRGWGDGLATLVKTLQRQGVPRQDGAAVVDRHWEAFRKRKAIPLVNEPERLTSNWVSIAEMPDDVCFYEGTGQIDEGRIKRRIDSLSYPAVAYGKGLFTFAGPQEIEQDFEGIARMHLQLSIPIQDFVQRGVASLALEKRDASSMMVRIVNDAWLRFCRERGMIEYTYSKSPGFHISPDQAANGERVPWGKQGTRRSSMLRNIARKHVWQFGVTALPAFWPFWHIKLKARVLFSEDIGTPSGRAIDDPKKMHRLRRSICKGWRNKQWHGRLLAFLEILSGDSAYIRISLAPGRHMLLASEPALFSSPVRTKLPDVLDPDGEEIDESTLGRPDLEDQDA